MQLSQISLYGKNQERRDLEFKCGTINVITGASKKGKSSIIDIVEYCLGSSECTVAEGRIRQTVDWYSIILQFPDTQVFISRAAPLPGAKANSSAHLLVAKEIDVPIASELVQTTNMDSVISFLTSKIGVPENVTEVPLHQTRSNINVGFKHSRHYLFQSQDEIANKKILFHRQAEPHIPQMIKDTLPYFLGAAEDDRLSEMEKLRSLKRERSVLLKRLNEIESLKGEGLQKGFSLLAEAAEVELYYGEDLIPTESELVEILRAVTKWEPNAIDSDHSDNDPIAILELQYKELTGNKNVVKMRLREATEYLAVSSSYENEVEEQSARLRSIGLFKKYTDKSEVCPICESSHDKESSYERIVRKAISDVDGKLDGVERNRPRVSSFVAKLQKQQIELASKIKITRQSIDAIRSEDIEISKKANLDIEKARVVGRISLYLDSIVWQEDTSSINNQIKLLEPQIKQLEEVLNPEVMKERLDSQLSIIAEDMTKWARELQLEHSEHRIRLDHKKLTVVSETPHGLIPLSNMGSGENWVGYHLVTYFALAKWFVEQNRPVGRFMILDQPTQVYFPSDTSTTGHLDEIEKDEDREAVKKMFKWIFGRVKELAPDIQVIITDHADIEEDWFQEAIRDEKWRGEEALIPPHWYASN